MVLLNGPGLDALNPALILFSFPFGTAPSGFTGVVQPQEATALSITIGCHYNICKNKIVIHRNILFDLTEVITQFIKLNVFGGRLKCGAAGVVVLCWANKEKDKIKALKNNTAFFIFTGLFVLKIVQKRFQARRYLVIYIPHRIWLTLSFVRCCKKL